MIHLLFIEETMNHFMLVSCLVLIGECGQKFTQQNDTPSGLQLTLPPKIKIFKRYETKKVSKRKHMMHNTPGTLSHPIITPMAMPSSTEKNKPYYLT